MTTEDEVVDDRKPSAELMFDKIVGSPDAFFKSQQRGEPELTAAEKRDILRRLYRENCASFLYRYHKLLNGDDLPLFAHCGDDEYEIGFYLAEIGRNGGGGSSGSGRRPSCLATPSSVEPAASTSTDDVSMDHQQPDADEIEAEQRRQRREVELLRAQQQRLRKRTAAAAAQQQTSSVARKNRRYCALRRMIREESEYFGDWEMRRRDPLLYDDMIGRYLNEQERRQLLHSGAHDGSTMSGMWLDFADSKATADVERTQRVERQMQRLLDVEGDGSDGDEQDVMDANEATSASDEDSPFEEEFDSDDDDRARRRPQTNASRVKQRVKSSIRSPTTGGDDVTRPVTCAAPSTLPAGARVQLRQEFIAIMHERFLAGHDVDHFDYAQVTLDILDRQQAEMAAPQPGTCSWYYKGEDGLVHGPYPSTEMLGWFRAGYFGMHLQLKREFETDDEYVTLQQLVSQNGGQVPFLDRNLSGGGSVATSMSATATAPWFSTAGGQPTMLMPIASGGHTVMARVPVMMTAQGTMVAMPSLMSPAQQQQLASAAAQQQHGSGLATPDEDLQSTPSVSPPVNHHSDNSEPCHSDDSTLGQQAEDSPGRNVHYRRQSGKPQQPAKQLNAPPQAHLLNGNAPPQAHLLNGNAANAPPQYAPVMLNGYSVDVLQPPLLATGMQHRQQQQAKRAVKVESYAPPASMNAGVQCGGETTEATVQTDPIRPPSPPPQQHSATDTDGLVRCVNSLSQTMLSDSRHAGTQTDGQQVSMRQVRQLLAPLFESQGIQLVD